MARDFIPHDNQYEALDWIHRKKRCAVWAPMGFGKSGTTLKALDDLSLVEEVFPAIIFAPKRVAISTWGPEAKKWSNLAHLRIVAVVGTLRERIAALKVPADIYTINYENIAWLVEYLGDRWPFKTVVADEAPKLKSYRTRQGGKNSGALAKVAHTHVERFIELTGTPSPNGIKDLWGQCAFLDKGERLGKSFSAFEARWFRKGFDGFSLEPFPHSQKEIESLLADICLTVKGLPVDEPIVSPVYVDLDPKSRALYREMEKNFFIELEEVGVEAVNAAVKTSKLLQICSGFAYHEDGKSWTPIHSLKLEALESIIEEACGAPVLVSYQFKSDAERLLKHFKRAKLLDTDPKTLERWNAGGIPILLAHPASAGHGLNMADGGNILARFGVGWGLEEFMQITERIGPMRQKQAGYDRPMFDYPILARGTFDEVVYDRLASKKTVQQALLDALRARKREQTQ